MQSSKIWRITSSIASAVRHVASSSWNQMLPISSSSTKTRSTWLSLLIFEEKWPNYASGPKSAPNSDSIWVRGLFNVCVWVFCAKNATILLVYIAAKIKISFIWKDDFFLPKSASSVSRSQPRSQRCSSVCTTIFVRQNDKTNYLSNPTWAKLTYIHTYIICHYNPSVRITA